MSDDELTWKELAEKFDEEQTDYAEEQIDRALVPITRELLGREDLPTADKVDALLTLLGSSPQPEKEALLPDNIRVIKAMCDDLATYAAQVDEIKGRLKGGRWTLVSKAMRQLGSKKASGDAPLRVVKPNYIAKVKDVLADAPVGEHHVIPTGWTIRDESTNGTACVLREAEKGDQVVRIPVAYKPIVISRWHNNLADGSKYLEVQWKASWKWRKATIPRAQLHDAAKIVPALAGRGFPVNSNNRVEVVRYLADYETANVPAMPNEAISEQMGWVRDGVRRGFLAGDRLIAVGPGAPILFHPPGDGEAQLVKALKPTGDFETWRAAIAGLAPYPRVMVGVYASLATPLLELLCKPGFIVDWSHRTSTGKTVVLRAAASAWGNPDERSGYSLIQTWNTTMVGFERLAGALQSLPIILDDTKTAVRPQMVSDILYQAAVGHGKTRGAISGSRATAGWRTILLSTGERRAIDFTKDGGTAARCLPLWGPPFGRTSAEIAVQIRNLEEAIFSNYGHAGPRFVEWLLRQDVDELRERYAAVNTRVFDELRQGVNVAVASRMGYGVAVLEFAGLLVHEALELPWEYQSPWVKLLGGVTESLRDADRAKEAFSHVHAWAVERQELFWGRRTEKAYGDNPPSRWLGSWKGDELAFTTPALREALESAGYEMDPIVRQWAERRWLKRTSRHKRTSRATIGPSGDRPQCYVLRLRSRKRGSNA